MAELPLDRQAAAQHGKRLEYFTIVWNSLEGLVGIIAGAIAGSISLVAFGIDSFIEVASGAALLWRMSVDANELQRERNERLALRIVGACFIALSIYIAYESITDLLAHHAPEHSVPGIILACVSLVVMPLLSRAKKKVGNEFGSAAMCTQMLNRLIFVCICQSFCSLVCFSMQFLDGGGRTRLRL